MPRMLPVAGLKCKGKDMIHIGNAPCSWGVEFAADPRNPDWRRVLSDCAAAGYRGIELGPRDPLDLEGVWPISSAT